MATVNPSTAIAHVLVDELIAGGVTDAVLAPGSRNAPLSLALERADRSGRLRLHVRIDERTAGFLALGLAKAAGRPVPVITTSGTAVANLHPAVVEADLSGVPLLVLSADRPPWMRDVGANQVIDQVRLFGAGTLRFFHEFEPAARTTGQNARWRSMVCRALAHAAGSAGSAGPVQLNVCLADPLMPDSSDPVLDLVAAGWPESLQGRGGPWTRVDPGGVDQATAGTIPAPAAGERCLIVADLTTAVPVGLAGHPVISEAGGVAGPGALAAGFHLLNDTAFMAAHRPDRVIVLGRPTLHRAVTALLTDPENHVDLVASGSNWRGLAGNVRRVASRLATGAGPAPADWSQAWIDADAKAGAAVQKVLAESDMSSSLTLAAELVTLLDSGTQLIIGSSQPARDLSLSVTSSSAGFGGPGPTVTANRGAAGIDGTISTAVGAALGFAGPTVAYLGDLTLLHDLTGLVIGPAEPRPDLVIVVSNNDGGGIFGTLESGDSLHAQAFERVFGTPHGADLGLLVRGAGHEHRRVRTTDELAEALRNPHGIRVVEVITDRQLLRSALADLKQAVAAALG